MLPDVARCCQMLPDVARCCQMLPDVARCCQMLPGSVGQTHIASSLVNHWKMLEGIAFGVSIQERHRRHRQFGLAL